jgi:S-adenosylmethionine synthetase
VAVQVAYAIGVAAPVSLNINTYGTAKVKDKDGYILSDARIAEMLKDQYDMRPGVIVRRFGLKNPIYAPTASYGHFGRDSREDEVEVLYQDKDTVARVIDGKTRYFKTVTFFPWEKDELVPHFRKLFQL